MEERTQGWGMREESVHGGGGGGGGCKRFRFCLTGVAGPQVLQED